MASKRKYESEFSDDLPAAKSQKLNRNFKDSWKMALPEISLTSVWHLKNGQDRRLAEFLNNKYLKEATERRVLQYAVK